MRTFALLGKRGYPAVYKVILGDNMGIRVGETVQETKPLMVGLDAKSIYDHGHKRVYIEISGLLRFINELNNRKGVSAETLIDHLLRFRELHEREANA